MKPHATATPMFEEKAIKKIVIAAGIASDISSKFICLITDTIKIPMIINTALQAEEGIIPNNGEKNNPVKNKRPTKTAVKPERPPA